jgi:predicted permease
LNLCRGLLATLLGALGGALVSVALALGFTVCGWLVAGTKEVDRQHDVDYLKQYTVYPIVGCAVVCACAAWATFAPARTRPFARSLGLIFLVSVPLWYVIGWMELTPRRNRGTEHPVFYPSELIVLIGPPLVAAAFLTVLRIRDAATTQGSQKGQDA